MLISFEGIDGSGKSTQINLLKEELLKRGKRVQVFREPGGTELSEKVRELLLDKNHQINSITELLLFSAARSELVHQKVIPSLDNGDIVILDRFFDSTTAYQGYGRSSIELKNIQAINSIASHGKSPDLTFYLKLSLEESLRRTVDQEKDRMETSGHDFFQRVIEGFDSLAESESRIKTIYAFQSVENVHKEILREVDKLL